jgi:ribonuclease HII
MAKIKLYRISINVHPAVFRYIDNTYPQETGIYNITKSPFYFLVSSMLSRNFYHYGWQIVPLQQCRFSKAILQIIIDQACNKIALAHVIAGIPRDQAIREVILENLFEDNEMNYSSLRKIYQRKYIAKEKAIREYLENITDDHSQEHLNYQKKNGKLVPTYYKL